MMMLSACCLMTMGQQASPADSLTAATDSLPKKKNSSNA